MSLPVCGSCDFWIPTDRGGEKFGECHYDNSGLSPDHPGKWPLTYARMPGCSNHSVLKGTREDRLVETLEAIAQALQRLGDDE